jgi:two-component system NtrC family sensor kinase
MEITQEKNRRVLVVDDNEAIHHDFRKILGDRPESTELSARKAELFGAADEEKSKIVFELACAIRGQDGLAKVVAARDANRPFALAFVDMRMPSGWDGVETIQQIWQVDRKIQIVICTAYSDYAWSEIIEKLGQSDNLLILKKPFDNIEVSQLAAALTDKWWATSQAGLKMEMLEQLVAQRTATLQQEIAERERVQQLLREKENLTRRARRLESIGQLAGGIAHEFNNLLQTIQGYTCIVQDELSPDEPAYADLEKALVATQRAATLTGQLLTFSRGQSLERSTIDVNEAVTNVVSLLECVLGKEIELTVSLDEKVGVISADTEMIQQVVMNLCLNARDAMPSGGKLTITTADEVLTDNYCAFHPDTEPGRYVLLSVTDTGCGMTPEVIEHVFEPFFTTREVGQRTGLGLTTVYRLVRHHGGVVTAYSEPNVGSTFRVRLPADAQATAQPPQAADSCQVPEGHQTILIADDEKLIRDVAVRILNNAGYRTLEAADGRQCVALFEQHRNEIGLLVLDVVMPKLNGRDAYRQIHEMCPTLPAIFCTGYDPTASRNSGAVSEDCLLIEKPFKPEILVRAVREALDAVVPCEPILT